jgi:hypothetical protein
MPDPQLEALQLFLCKSNLPDEQPNPANFVQNLAVESKKKKK